MEKFSRKGNNVKSTVLWKALEQECSPWEAGKAWFELLQPGMLRDTFLLDKQYGGVSKLQWSRKWVLCSSLWRSSKLIEGIRINQSTLKVSKGLNKHPYSCTAKAGKDKLLDMFTKICGATFTIITKRFRCSLTEGPWRTWASFHSHCPCLQLLKMRKGKACDMKKRNEHL